MPVCEPSRLCTSSISWVWKNCHFFPSVNLQISRVSHWITHNLDLISLWGNWENLTWWNHGFKPAPPPLGSLSPPDFSRKVVFCVNVLWYWFLSNLCLENKIDDVSDLSKEHGLSQPGEFVSSQMCVNIKPVENDQWPWKFRGLVRGPLFLKTFNDKSLCKGLCCPIFTPTSQSCLSFFIWTRSDGISSSTKLLVEKKPPKTWERPGEGLASSSSSSRLL